MQEDLTVGLFFSDYEYTNYWDNYRLFFCLVRVFLHHKQSETWANQESFQLLAFCFYVQGDECHPLLQLAAYGTVQSQFPAQLPRAIIS